MPQLIGERTALVHIPKTAGTWIRSACGDAGLDVWHMGDVHAALSSPIRDRVVLGVVRDPCDWLRSFWAYAGHEKRGKFYWTPLRHIAALLKDGSRYVSFEAFIDRYLATMPGELTRVFREYLQHVDVVIAFDDIINGLIRALNDNGEQFNEEAIMYCPPKNRGLNSAKAAARLVGDRREAIERAEADMPTIY